MHVVGPLGLRLLFQAAVVVVGFLMLSGAVNTAIVGSNGVLNRVSEDGVLTDWFRKPHRRFGTTYRLINLIVILQLLTIVASRGDVILLGEAYAFGVVWSFAFNALSVLVLRYKMPNAPRDWKVPGNLHIGGREWPLGLMFIASVLFAAAVINLFTKEVATISGMAFTGAFFAVFVVSERMTARRRAAAGGKLDQFQLTAQPDVDMTTLNCAPHNILVPVRDYNSLSNLDWVVSRPDTENRDIVVVTLRLLRGPAAGAGNQLGQDELFTDYEQQLFTRVVAVAERCGRNVKLLVAPATSFSDAVVQTAVQLQSDEIVIGESAKMPADQQALLIGDAWDRTPHPRELTTHLIVQQRDGRVSQYLPWRARAGAVAAGRRTDPPALGRGGEGSRTRGAPSRHRQCRARGPRGGIGGETPGRGPGAASTSRDAPGREEMRYTFRTAFWC